MFAAVYNAPQPAESQHDAPQVLAPERPAPRRQRRDQQDSRARELLHQLTRARANGDHDEITQCEEAATLHYLGVANAMARRFGARGIDPEDLLQVARMGLIKAVRGWRPGRGDGLLQYAVPMVTGELRRYLRDQGTSVRVPRRIQQNRPAITIAQTDLESDGHHATDREIATAAGLDIAEIRAYHRAYRQTSTQSLDAPTVDGELPTVAAPEAEREFGLVEDRVQLQRGISRLSDRERKLISLRFFHDQTQEQIGRVLGVSQMQISRLLRDTLAKLRSGLVETDARATDSGGHRRLPRAG